MNKNDLCFYDEICKKISVLGKMNPESLDTLYYLSSCISLDHLEDVNNVKVNLIFNQTEKEKFEKYLNWTRDNRDLYQIVLVEKWDSRHKNYEYIVNLGQIVNNIYNDLKACFKY